MIEPDFDKGGGLIPAIIQDADTGRVLMLGYMNEEALEATRREGRVTFFSRSNQRLWTKGESSGNTLSLVEIRTDCDGDALLVRVRPAGPTCHLGRTSCFDGEDGDRAVAGLLDELDTVIAGRAGADPATSYTARLLAAGAPAIARKLGEESVETILAAVNESDKRLGEEAADLMYHLLILLRSRSLGLADVTAALAGRRR